MDVPTTTETPALVTLSEVEKVISLYLKETDRQPATRDAYRKAVTAFFRWVESTGRTVPGLTNADVIAYKEHLAKRKLSTLTIAAYINSVRNFYAWAEAAGICRNIAARVTLPKRKQEFRRRPLSVSKAAELLENTASTASLRDFAIINLMLRTGLRCVEVVRANVGDIQHRGEQNVRVLLVQGKGHTEKDDFVVLDEAAFEPIRKYLATRKGATAAAPLFASEAFHTAKECNHQTEHGETLADYDPRRLSTRTVSAVVKRSLQAVGLDSREFTAHSLRHTAGTNILRAGGTLVQAQLMLRHANINTTEIYTRMDLKDSRLTENSGEVLLSRLYADALA